MSPSGFFMALPRLRLWQLLVSVHFFGRTH